MIRRLLVATTLALGPSFHPRRPFFFAHRFHPRFYFYRHHGW
ncbi:hypothetical protein ACTXG6_30625 [Pseudonocardia sp. Cha107L01]|jgi:hypothetical protein